MRYYESVLDAIGRTPLVKLARVTGGLPITLLAKLEYLNPGGSVKDRIGLAMVAEAERQGLLQPGGTIIEATAGNTGVGLALVAATRGYRCIFVLPDKMSEEKINLLKAYGAEVVVTPSAVPADSPESYSRVADRLAREIPGAFRSNQFADQRNPEAHYRTTGPEIWEDTDGKVDVFVAGVGTGGTISGVGRYLKEQNPSVLVVGAEPEGSSYSGGPPGPYAMEGIGGTATPATFHRQVVDEMLQVSDAEAFAVARRLAREEGLLVGGSSGTAVAAAIQYARRLEPGKLVVALLPDTGRNYLSKLFSDRWMREKGFLENAPEQVTAGDVLRRKQGMRSLVSLRPDARAIEAVTAMERYGISHVPVIDGRTVVGTLSEVTLVKLLHDGVDLRAKTASEVMGKPLPGVDLGTDVSEVYRLLLAGYGGVIITNDGVPYAFLARIDLVDYWMASSRRAA